MDADSVAVLKEALGDLLKCAQTVYLYARLTSFDSWLARDQQKYFLAPLTAYDNTDSAYANLSRA